MRNVLGLLSPLFVLASVASADQPPAPKLVQTIPLDGVQGRIDHMAADVAGKRLFIAALGNDSVEVIDLAAGKRERSLRDLKQPTGIRVLPGSRNVVVATGGDGKVHFFDADLKPIATLDGLDDADNVRLDPAGKRVYVGYGDGAIAVIDAESRKKIADIKLDGHPEAFALETKGQRMFVNVPSAKQVAVIDREKAAVVARWPLTDAHANYPMALDETNHRLFIACRSPASLVVLDTESGKTVTSIPCAGDADDVFYDAEAKRVYVSGGAGVISVIVQADRDTYAEMLDVKTEAGARTSVYIPEMRRLCVAVPRSAGHAAEIRVYELPGGK
jgi:YVTN family beta-propeller protein